MRGCGQEKGVRSQECRLAISDGRESRAKTADCADGRGYERLRPRRFEPRGFTGECLVEPKGINRITVAVLLVAMATHVFSCQRPLRNFGRKPD